MIGLGAGAVLPIAAMFLLIRRTAASECGLAISVAAASALGLGVSSLLWWCLLQLPLYAATALAAIDIGIWVVVSAGIAMGVPRRPRLSRRVAPTERRLPGLLLALVVFIPAAGCAAASFAAESAVIPHGAWDAWAIWNVRARFLFLGFPSWQEAFAPPAAHPDYPLLLPASIARAWAFAGEDSVLVPIAVAAVFAATVVVVAAVSIGREGSSSKGLLTAAFILASPAFVAWAPSQFADVPLSAYMLLTLVFGAAAARRGTGSSLWAFAGLSAGLAAWTKNEGLVFALVALLTNMWFWRAVDGHARWRGLVAIAAGAVPVLLVLAAFKLSVATSNDIVSALSVSRLMEMFGDRNRLSIVAAAVGRELWFGGATIVGVLPIVALYVALAGGSGRGLRAAAPALVTLAVVLAAYTAVYVVTPNDLYWHMRTSLDRVVLQLTPSFVWAGMLVTVWRGDHVVSRA